MIKKHTLFLCLFVLVFTVGLKAANDNYPFGGRAAGMGNAAVTLYDFWALSHNQAGLARMENMATGVFFENRFLIEELSFGAAGFVYPTSSGVLGVSFTYFGFELYNETKIGLAYAMEFGERLSTGLQLNYHYTGIGESYGNKGNLTFELGAIFHILPQLSIGMHLFNPSRTKIGDFADERIPTILKTGFGYEFSDRVVVIVEADHSVNQSPVVKVGMEYRISDPIYLRGGIGTNPVSNSFGFGLELGNLNIDLATSWHQVLGYSPQLSMVYHFK